MQEPVPASSTAVCGGVSASPAAQGALSVYFDGACPLCRAEIATYRSTEGGESLRWVDASACAEADLGGGLERSAALARLHVRRADGRLIGGAAAFIEIWSALPRWRWLARIGRLPGVTPTLELGYRGFLRVRPLWRPTAPQAAAARTDLPRPLLRELRTDHAGETGAVMIYRGILAITRDPALRAFAQAHLAAESRHLAAIESVVDSRWRSRLLPLWRMSGWLTGALPALAGPRAVYATIQAVETFVDRHYAAQLDLIDGLTGTSSKGDHAPRVPESIQVRLQSLRELLLECQRDEVAHRDDAAGRWDQGAGWRLRLWRWIVAAGSEAAVGVCRRV